MTAPAVMMDRRMHRRLWARSLALQACWNFEGMQNLGLAYGLEPWLEALYPDPGARRAALSRHLDFFNTNPYLEPLIVGMACALEEESAQAPEDRRLDKLARLATLKKAASAPLAGLGDALFWQTLRPFCAAAALVTGLCLWKAGAPLALAGMAVSYLVVYNIPTGTLRWQGFLLGYAWRDQIATRLKGYPWQTWIRRLRLAGTAMAASLILLALAFAGSPAERLVGVLSTLVCLIVDRVVLRSVSPTRLYAGASVLGVLAAIAGWL